MSNKNFPNAASLKKVYEIVNEASLALGDETRVKAEITIPEAAFGAVGGAAGVGISLAALYGLGTVGLSAAGITSALATAGAVIGGGMAAGVFVIAAPVAALGVGGVLITRAVNAKQLSQQKRELLPQIGEKLDSLRSELSGRGPLNAERVRYLQALIVLLEAAANDLHEDLA